MEQSVKNEAINILLIFSNRFYQFIDLVLDLLLITWGQTVVAQIETSGIPFQNKWSFCNQIYDDSLSESSLSALIFHRIIGFVVGILGDSDF